MNERPYKIKTGIVCKYCGWDDVREWEWETDFELVCPKCRRRWKVPKAEPIPCDVNGYCRTCD